jgi:hypothetical protein
VDVRRAGKFDITVRLPKAGAAGKVHFRLNEVRQSAEVAAGADSVELHAVSLPKGAGRLAAEAEIGSARTVAHYVDVSRRNDA